MSALCEPSTSGSDSDHDPFCPEATAAPAARAEDATAVQPDAELLFHIARGSRPALAALYDRYAKLLLSLAQRLLGTRSHAEDLVHDLFLEVWNRADSYDPGRGSVRTWLLLRLRSRALDRLKSGAWRLEQSRVPVEDSGLAARHSDPEQDLCLHASYVRIRAAMQVLSDEERGLIDLIYVSGLSLSEVGEKLSLPLGTVKSRLSRMLTKLRDELRTSSSEV